MEQWSNEAIQQSTIRAIEQITGRSLPRTQMGSSTFWAAFRAASASAAFSAFIYLVYIRGVEEQNIRAMKQ